MSQICDVSIDYEGCSTVVVHQLGSSSIYVFREQHWRRDREDDACRKQ